MIEQKKEIIKSVVFSLFDADGPSPIVYWPEDLDESARLLIAMKTISLLMGDSVYQNGTTIEGINYFGILPFPDLKLNGLTYFFLIPDALTVVTHIMTRTNLRTQLSHHLPVHRDQT